MDIMVLWLHFNSIKVQLEHSKLTNTSAISLFQFHKGTIRTSLLAVHTYLTNVFQFHKGTIRTKPDETNENSLFIFQFHKGTIRTTLALLFDHLVCNFNSIKVQLEPDGSVPDMSET